MYAHAERGKNTQDKEIVKYSCHVMRKSQIFTRDKDKIKTKEQNKERKDNITQRIKDKYILDGQRKGKD